MSSDDQDIEIILTSEDSWKLIHTSQKLTNQVETLKNQMSKHKNQIHVLRIQVFNSYNQREYLRKENNILNQRLNILSLDLIDLSRQLLIATSKVQQFENCLQSQGNLDVKTKQLEYDTQSKELYIKKIEQQLRNLIEQKKRYQLQYHSRIQHMSSKLNKKELEYSNLKQITKENRQKYQTKKFEDLEELEKKQQQIFILKQSEEQFKNQMSLLRQKCQQFSQKLQQINAEKQKFIKQIKQYQIKCQYYQIQLKRNCQFSQKQNKNQDKKLDYQVKINTIISNYSKLQSNLQSVLKYVCNLNLQKQINAKSYKDSQHNIQGNQKQISKINLVSYKSDHIQREIKQHQQAINELYGQLGNKQKQIQLMQNKIEQMNQQQKEKQRQYQKIMEQYKKKQIIQMMDKKDRQLQEQLCDKKVVDKPQLQQKISNDRPQKTVTQAKRQNQYSYTFDQIVGVVRAYLIFSKNAIMSNQIYSQEQKQRLWKYQKQKLWTSLKQILSQ